MKPNNRIYLFFVYFSVSIFILACTNIQNQTVKSIKKQYEDKVIEMKLTSSVFIHNGAIPSEYTCDGADVSPPLTISDVPKNAKSLALIMDDPDAPVGTWDHWIIFNIPTSITQISKGTEPKGVAGKNSWGRTGYGGPCPPSGTHRYFFKLYALDTELNLPESSNKKALEKAMEGHIIEKDELVGMYRRR